MGYPADLLSTRAVIRRGMYAVIPSDGLVNNVLPYLSGCRTSIIASPKMGAGFAMYVCWVQPKGRTVSPFGGLADEECFLYVIEGALQVKSEETVCTLTPGGYLYAPPGKGILFTNLGDIPAKLLLYRQRYTPCAGLTPYLYSGNTEQIPYRDYDDMTNVHIKDLLPQDLNFDMNMHILSFDPGGCHPFVETHVQEHGMYILRGQGMYLIDDTWMGIKAGDFVWFGAYVPQCAYGVGQTPFTYIYSKDCHRDVAL